DTWLTFQLYPDPTGISVRITPAAAPRSPAAPASGAPAGSTVSASPAEPVRVGSLYRLLELASTLTEAVGVRDVVDLAAGQLLPAFDAQALALLVIDAGRLRVIGHRGYPPELIDRLHGAPLLPSGSPAMLPADDHPAFFSSRAEMNRAHPYLVNLDDGMASWALLPLFISGRRLGTCVLAYDHPHHFTADERTLLTALGGLLAQALDRARLYDVKYQLAHGLQAALLPRALPRFPGLEVAARYLPATQGIDIGGDFYDLLCPDPTTAGAVIADVQGHNVTAAALMGQVRTAVHAHAGAAPDQVLARTNRLLCDLAPDLFTSCLYAHLDLAHHHALLANAGHPPPLLRHPDGRTEILDLPTGLLLGIDPAATYRTTRVPLPTGTLLVLYTDGLVESARTDLTEATERLADLLAATGHRPLDELADLLLDHAPRHHGHTDDVALLLLRPTAPAPVQDTAPPPTGP
ncbi:MAG TPA: PP2C family protein-serine/threonine phosphatase, partial [Streptomyces sp.]|nr:PP2C family protein-serine/threonine phosphatase [Streptomyces sp.]